MKNKIYKILVLFLFFSYHLSLNAQSFKGLTVCETTPDIILFLEGNKFGFYDLKNNKVLIKAKFEDATLFQQDETLITQGDSINTKYGGDSYATVLYRKQFYRMDKDGKLVYKIPLLVEAVPAYVKYRYRVCYTKNADGDRVYGLKEDNKQTVDYIYDSIQPLFYLDKENSFFIVEKDKKYGIIDHKGNLILDIVYDDIDNPVGSRLQKFGVILIVLRGTEKKVIDLCKNVYNR